MKIGVFTDNDFGKVNGVTTTLKAVLAHARRDGLDLVHYTTPGPIGLVAQYVAWRLGVPMTGSFHTLLAEYTEVLSGSPRLGELMRQDLRWPYGQCATVLVPSEETRARLIRAHLRPERVTLWRRGGDTVRFAPVRRSAEWRTRYEAGPDDVVFAYVGRLSREKRLDIRPEWWRAMRARHRAARLVCIGGGDPPAGHADPPTHERRRARCHGGTVVARWAASPV